MDTLARPENNDRGKPVRLFPEGTVPCKTNEQTIISKVLKESHFSSYLLGDTVFQELAATSIDSVSEKWFSMVCSGMTDESESLFDTACQQMMLSIWRCMETATRSAKSRVESSYHYQLLTYLQSDEMEDQIGLLPVGLRD